MPDSIIRAAYRALLPDGQAWAVKPGSDLDLLFDGIAINDMVLKDFLSTISNIRNPFLVEEDLIPDLEKEYGISTDETLSIQERREQLAAIVYATRGTGSRTYLQDRLHEAGFTNLFVYHNSPAVNPNDFIVDRAGMWCGMTEAVCGHEDAFCALFDGGEYVVNGDIYDQTVGYDALCGGLNSVCGNQEAVCGNVTSTKELIEYTVPDTDGNWNLVFFVGGTVERDGTGAIIDIEIVPIESKLRESLRRIILRHKPATSWGALSVRFT